MHTTWTCQTPPNNWSLRSGICSANATLSKLRRESPSWPVHLRLRIQFFPMRPEQSGLLYLLILIMSLLLNLEDRRLLLADAPRYFTAAERILRSCVEVDVSSPIPIPRFQQDFGIWKGEVLFTSGHVLKFHETYSKHPDGLLERIVNYDFRERHANEVTFRVDAHGVRVMEDGEFHVDLPRNLIVTESEIRSKGYSLTCFTMIDMICLIRTHLEGKALPWA